jgi:hypothetical protein
VGGALTQLPSKTEFYKPRNYIQCDAANKAEDAFEISGFLYFAVEAVRDSQVAVNPSSKVEEN